MISLSVKEEGHSLHALSRLPGYVDQLDHLKLGFDDVQVVVEAGAFAPLGDDGQLRLGGVAHEEQDVDVTGFPVANTHAEKLHQSDREDPNRARLS